MWKGELAGAWTGPSSCQSDGGNLALRRTEINDSKSRGVVEVSMVLHRSIVRAHVSLEGGKLIKLLKGRAKGEVYVRYI